MTRTARILISGTAILVIIAVCGAGQPAAKFTELQRRDIPGTGREGVTTVTPPGRESFFETRRLQAEVFGSILR